MTLEFFSIDYIWVILYNRKIQKIGKVHHKELETISTGFLLKREH